MTRRKKKVATLSLVRNVLGAIWLIAALLVLTIPIYLLNDERTYRDEVWKWAVPMIGPTFGLIIATLTANYAVSTPSNKIKVSKSFFIWTIVLSLIYLTTIIYVISVNILAAFAGQVDGLTQKELVESLGSFNIPLGLFQGAVATTIGTLFFTQQPKE